MKEIIFRTCLFLPLDYISNRQWLTDFKSNFHMSSNSPKCQFLKRFIQQGKSCLKYLGRNLLYQRPKLIYDSYHANENRHFREKGRLLREVLWRYFIPWIFILNTSRKGYELHSLHSCFYIYFQTANIKIYLDASINCAINLMLLSANQKQHSIHT